MSDNYEVSRLLLPSIIVFEERDRHAFFASGKILPFILEELVSRGISQIVVADPWRYRDDLVSLPKVFQKCLIELDDSKNRAIACQIFRPFFEEFGIETSNTLEWFKPLQTRVDSKRGKAIHDKAIDAGIAASTALPRYLDALTARGQCQFDVGQMMAALAVLERACRSPEMRANIAILQGIFRSYRSISCAALDVRINSATAMVGLFEELVQDGQYKALSHEASKLGLSPRIHVIKRKISSLVKAIVRSDVGKQVLDYGSTAITVATGVPLPKSELAESLMRDSYFPPIVDISQAIRRARKKMIQAHPDTKFTSSFLG